MSPDEKFAIVYQITKYKYRHSFYANYTIVNLTDPIGARRNVTVDPTGNNDVQYCGFSPTGHTLVGEILVIYIHFSKHFLVFYWRYVTGFSLPRL